MTPTYGSAVIEKNRSERRHRLMGQRVRAFVLTLLVVLFFVACALASGGGFWQYVDEISMVVFGCWLVAHALRNGMCAQTARFLLLVAALTVIGICGNLYSGIERTPVDVAVDWASCFKAPIAYFAVYELFDDVDAHQVAQNLASMAKVLIVLAAVFGTVSLISNIGMSGQVRYGVRAFHFVFRQEHVLAIVMMSSLMLVLMVHNDRRSFCFYSVLASYVQLLTTKGPSLVWVAMLWILVLITGIGHEFHLKLWHAIPLGILGILLGDYQIDNYLSNRTSPRYLLWKFGVTTANTYIPLGSGFGTFGSDVANKDYSPLYVKYGFVSQYGMMPGDGRFLNDNYWPMVMAEFGYLGIAGYACIYALILKVLQNGQMGRWLRIVVSCSFVYILVHSIGSALPTSSEGMLLMIALALTACSTKKGEGVTEHE